MGTPVSDRARLPDGRAPVHTFYSSNTWIEGKALDQLDQVASLAGVQGVAAFPDLHPGRYGPVGCAVLADRLYPHLIGNDIGCGMSLFALDIPLRKIRLDRAAKRLRALELSWDGPPSGAAAAALAAVGLADCPHAQALGSIGGGNHFCELQGVDSLDDEAAAEAVAITRNTALLLVHSGSRSLGMEVFEAFLDSEAGRDNDGLISGSQSCLDYLVRHDQAVAWASLNREIIARRAAALLQAECTRIADAPHNLVERHAGGFLHRKGAARAAGGLIPLAGSRDSLSYLLKPNPADPNALASLAHGAGRKYDRRSMAKRIGTSRSERETLARTSFGGFVVCEDRQLLLEEAPVAYKKSGQVLDDLVAAGLAEPVASLKPLVTFKKAMERDDMTAKPSGKSRKRQGRVR